jgi:hypothetical protein
MGLSDFPPGPTLPSRAVGCSTTWRRTGRDLPCCYRTPLANMLSSLPRWTRTEFVSLAYCPMAAFPMFGLGRHPHSMVSGLARCSFGLRPVGSLTHFWAFCTKGFETFHCFHVRLGCYRLERKLPGGFIALPLEFCAFPRRTQTGSKAPLYNRPTLPLAHAATMISSKCHL